VSCGDSHTLVVSVDGRAYSFGSSPDGQLGLGTSVQRSDAPALISSLTHHRIIQVEESSAYASCWLTSFFPLKGLLRTKPLRADHGRRLALHLRRRPARQIGLGRRHLLQPAHAQIGRAIRRIRRRVGRLRRLPHDGVGQAVGRRGQAAAARDATLHVGHGLQRGLRGQRARRRRRQRQRLALPPLRRQSARARAQTNQHATAKLAEQKGLAAVETKVRRGIDKNR